MNLRFYKRALCVVLAVCLTLSGSAVIQAQAKSPVSICSDEEWEVLKLVNKERTSRGLEPLSVTKKLQQANDVRANEIYLSFSHTRPDGTSCFTALQAVGENYSCAGENIAAGYGTPEAVMEGWMNSPGHKANILTGSFTHMGMGYYYNSSGMYGRYWTQMFTGICTPTSISVKGSDKISSYKRGTNIESMNRVLVVKCEHGTSYVPLTTQMCSKINRSTTGVKRIQVKYRGKTTTFQIRITGISIAKAKVTNVKTKVYNGKAQTQKPKVVLNGKTLVKNKDYTISYKNNKKVGTATMTITGKGAYSGTIKKNFKIIRKKS